MLTKNLTPFLLGTKVCSRRPPQPEMTIIVRGAFALRPGEALAVDEKVEQGALSAETFLEEDEDRKGECVYPGDFADYKLNAEVLLKGTCHAPRGRPVTECLARVAVGAWSKSLRVVGPRAFSDRYAGALASEPLPFTKMPLDYAHAFGGPAYAKNPVGKGHESAELPCIEDPASPIQRRGADHEPASFGPINPAWPQRASKVGKEYGKSYQEKRAPYQAEDFDWSYFSAAPPDQQIKGFLRGDEDVVFQNLHPTVPLISTKLPGLRIRAFVKDREKRFREAHMSLDTVHADLDEGLLYLTWRGLCEVREDDLADVAFVFIASEPLAERPLPEGYYKVLLDEFERDPTGVLAAMPPGLLEAGEALERRRKGQDAPAAASQDLAQNPVSGAIGDTFGKLMSPDTGKRIDQGLSASSAAAERTGNTALAPAMAAAVKNIGTDTAPTPMPRRPGVMPNLGLKQQMRAVMAKVAELKKTAATTGKPIAGIEALEALPHDPRLKQLDPNYSVPGPISTDEPGPGRNLAEQDLKGRDLHGMDLSAATLESADLTGANLAGAKLRGCNLRNAILYKADLTGADLTGADLTLANAVAARAAGADFTGATMDMAFFENANLTDANLTEVNAPYAIFAKAVLEGAVGTSAVFDHADFSEAVLDRASFAQASLTFAMMIQCRGRKLDMSLAKLTGANFSDAVIPGARFVQAVGPRSFWARAVIDDADFDHAVMIGAHFTEASAIGAKFFGANLRECRFYRATLERAEIVKANLFSADLCKSKLAGAKFTGSSLYDAKLLQASGSGCDFTGANLKRSTLERA
ncbi:Pentapeptide repeat family protein [Minicystis rosea]|nr:Pentapeptide repeat family protein [Minicystis rosea]